MQSGRTLYRSETAGIIDIRCRPGNCDCGGDEQLSTLDITFPRAGAFVRHIGRRQYLADPNHVIFFNRKETYRVSHPVPEGDDCSIFNLSDQAIIDIIADFHPAAGETPDAPFPFRDAPSSPRLFAFHRRVMQYARDAAHDTVAIDECVLALVERAVQAAFTARGRRPVRLKPATRRAHRTLAHDARTILSEQYRKPLTLDGLARQVHSSAYHLARVFRQHTGLSIHRYLNRLRLRAGLDRVAGGEPNLTAIALDLGFGSHSHFSDAFRREFGCPPSRFRNAIDSSGIRQMSRFLEV